MASTTERIADKVRGVAAERRFTQERLAKSLGLSRTSIVERINGRVPFTATEILTLSEVMGVRVERFFPIDADVSPSQGVVDAPPHIRAVLFPPVPAPAAVREVHRDPDATARFESLADT